MNTGEHPLKRLCRSEPVVLEPGCHFGVPRDVYDNIPALSRTMLTKWLSREKVLSEFGWWLETRWEEPVSESQLLGSALDCMLLESQQFADKFAVIPNDAPPRPNIRTRSARNPSPAGRDSLAWWNDFEERAAGKQILTAAQNTACLEMMLAIRKAPTATGIFEHCQKAVLVGEVFGFPAKGEIDLWNPRIPYIMDLKTAVDVAPDRFKDAIKWFHYHDQAAFYLLLAQACGFEDKTMFSWVTVKNQAPWTVKVHAFAPFKDLKHFKIFQAAKQRLARAADAITQHLRRNDFADSQDWDLVQFDDWMVRQAEFELASQPTMPEMMAVET